MFTLDNRLTAAYELCREGKIAADVGCDHAQLACCLAINKSASVIASDVRSGPLEAARRTVNQSGVQNVRLLLSDGLDEVDFADDVIICGMGGELIADIAQRCRFKNEDTRFILQPMTKAEVMRRRLYAAGFELLEERTATDNGKTYSVMLWQYTGIPREIDEIEALCGKNRDRVYLEKIAEKLLKNAKNMDKSSDFVEEAERLRKIADTIMRIAVDSGK
ncbi:MAG: class I SAM-dependent methyltransferase [Oscillospiraceae bacterium]